MEKEKLHLQITQYLDYLHQLNNRLAKDDNRPAQLELDLLRKYCIDLYDTVNKLALTPKNVSISKAQVEVAAEIIPTPAPIISLPESAPEPEVSELVSEPLVQEQIKPQTPAPTEPSVKNVQSENSTRRSTLKKQMDPEVSALFEKFSSSPLESISKGISISKRFEFQSSFFEGNAVAYNSFLSELEAAPTLDQAFEVYQHYKTTLNWENQDLKDELKVLMYRKFM